MTQIRPKISILMGSDNKCKVSCKKGCNGAFMMSRKNSKNT